MLSKPKREKNNRMNYNVQQRDDWILHYFKATLVIEMYCVFLSNVYRLNYCNSNFGFALKTHNYSAGPVDIEYSQE